MEREHGFSFFADQEEKEKWCVCDAITKKDEQHFVVDVEMFWMVTLCVVVLKMYSS